MSELQTALIIFIMTLILDLERRVARIEAKMHEIYKYINDKINAGEKKHARSK
jgi:hypothetical protein